MYRALTIKREWAEKIAFDLKRFEVRNFRIDYLGPLVITLSREKIAYCVVDLVGFQRADQTPELSAAEREYGAWAWRLKNPRRCVPVPCIGKLGAWYWNAELPALLYPVQLQLL